MTLLARYQRKGQPNLGAAHTGSPPPSSDTQRRVHRYSRERRLLTTECLGLAANPVAVAIEVVRVGAHPYSQVGGHGAFPLPKPLRRYVLAAC